EYELVTGVDHHRQIIRLALIDQVHQHLRENKCRLGRLATRAAQVSERREICPENLGVSVDDVEGFGLCHRLEEFYAREWLRATSGTISANDARVIFQRAAEYVCRLFAARSDHAAKASDRPAHSRIRSRRPRCACANS